MVEPQVDFKRTHDSLYLTKDRYDKPKEMFKFISSHAFKQKSINTNLEVLDFGCATGEFLFYLYETHPELSLSGIDILPELIAKARILIPSASLEVGSVLNNDSVDSDSFDLIFMIGVHSIFDEFETSFNNLIEWTRLGGRVFIYGMFNPYPIDVLVKYRLSNESGLYESGWNIHSQESISNYLLNHPKVKNFEFHKFQIGIDLEQGQDLVRSWTIDDVNQNRMITNGLSLLQPHYLLEIVL